MEAAFGISPYNWQEDAICHPLKMTNECLGLPPAPVFLCQPTGGGKSLVRDTLAETQGAVSHGVLHHCCLYWLTRMQNPT
jgi:hypothetical protein